MKTEVVDTLPATQHVDLRSTTQLGTPMMSEIEAMQKNLLILQARTDIMDKFITDNLKEGIDFDPAFRGSAKKTLLKPGSEKVIQLLDLTAEFHDDTATRQHLAPEVNADNVCKVCTLINRHTGHKVAEGYGSCSIASKSGNLNTATKIACKRAQMDATLRVAALSGRFEQDLEDPEYAHVRNKAKGNSVADEKKVVPPKPPRAPVKPPKPVYDPKKDKGVKSTRSRLAVLCTRWAEYMVKCGETDTQAQLEKLDAMTVWTFLPHGIQIKSYKQATQLQSSHLMDLIPTLPVKSSKKAATATKAAESKEAKAEAPTEPVTPSNGDIDDMRLALSECTTIDELESLWSTVEEFKAKNQLNGRYAKLHQTYLKVKVELQPV